MREERWVDGVLVDSVDLPDPPRTTKDILNDVISIFVSAPVELKLMFGGVAAVVEMFLRNNNLPDAIAVVQATPVEGDDANAFKQAILAVMEV